MLDEKEKERLEKICPVELDFPVFLTLIQTSLPVGENEYVHDDWGGKKCHWCQAQTSISEEAYNDVNHEKYCPIRLSRTYLYNLGFPLRKVRLIGLVEIETEDSSFLRPVDEIFYIVGEVKQIEKINEYTENLLKSRFSYIKSPKYTIKFVELEELKEYRF